jgi:hypothetical protein
MKWLRTLVLESWSHDKESERGILFSGIGSGRHNISYLGRLTILCPRKPQELRWAYRLLVRSVSSQKDECIHIS